MGSTGFSLSAPRAVFCFLKIFERYFNSLEESAVPLNGTKAILGRD